MFDFKKKKMSEDMNPLEHEAKMGVLSSLKAEGEKGMLDQLQGMKKVEVASDSSEGLEAGLQKAKQLIEQRGQEDNLMGEKPQFSLEEINEVIEHLLEQKKLLEENASSSMIEAEE